MQSKKADDHHVIHKILCIHMHWMIPLYLKREWSSSTSITKEASVQFWKSSPSMRVIIDNFMTCPLSTPSRLPIVFFKWKFFYTQNVSSILVLTLMGRLGHGKLSRKYFLSHICIKEPNCCVCLSNAFCCESGL